MSTAFDTPADLRALLAEVGITPEDAGGTVEFLGEDPILPSVHRLGAASAVGMMANAVGVAAIWRMQTGREQDLRVDLRQSVQRAPRRGESGGCPVLETRVLRVVGDHGR